MEINNSYKSAALGFVIFAVTGSLGARIIRMGISSISPIGVGIACGTTAAIALGCFFSKIDPRAKFIGFVSAYPVGVAVANLLRFNVRFLDPVASITLGGTLVIPTVIFAGFLTIVSTLLIIKK